MMQGRLAAAILAAGRVLAGAPFTRSASRRPRLGEDMTMLKAGVFCMALGETLLAAAAPVLAGEAEERIRERAEHWVAAVAERDIDAIMALYAEDGRVMPPGAPPLDGHEAVRAYWSQLLEIPGFELQIRPETVTVAESGELAVAVGSWELAFDGPEGRVEDRGSFMDIWRREGDDWQVAYDIINSDVAAGQ
jgi:ketosteroid isomerase-like protein